MPCDVEHLFKCLFAVYIFFDEMSESLAHFSIGQCLYICVYIYTYLEDSFMDLSLFFLCILLSEEITNRPGSFIPTPVEASLGSPHHSAMTQRNLLGCK